MCSPEACLTIKKLGFKQLKTYLRSKSFTYFVNILLILSITSHFECYILCESSVKVSIKVNSKLYG